MEHDKQYSRTKLFRSGGAQGTGLYYFVQRAVEIYQDVSPPALPLPHYRGSKSSAPDTQGLVLCLLIRRGYLLASHPQSNDAMSAVSFSVGERVLCYHGPLIYESKILKGEVWDEANTKLETVGPHYLVHYKGWKQTCVPTRICPSLVFLILLFF
jgi:hypothetical protein